MRWISAYSNYDKTTSEKELKKLTEMDNIIKRAEEKLEYLGTDEETLALYKAREDSLHERANMIYLAKEEGKIEGKIEGKLATAKNLLLMGMNVK